MNKEKSYRIERKGRAAVSQQCIDEGCSSYLWTGWKKLLKFIYVVCQTCMR